MPHVTRPGQQRIIPDHSIPLYQGKGWMLSEAPDLPTSSDRKEVWVNHAIAQGMSRGEAERATKADLMERFGG